MAVRTWAPRGQTPVLRVKLTRDHLSAISGITLDGRLFLQVRPTSYDAEAVVGFLRVLLRKISGKIVLIWDGSPIHRAHEITDFLKRGAAKRLHLEQLPGYAPDLNPAEGIWNYLKRVEVGNVCCANLVIVRNLVAPGRAAHFRPILPSSKATIPHFRAILPLKANALPHFDDLYQLVNNHALNALGRFRH